jgi:hypothetical protein
MRHLHQEKNSTDFGTTVKSRRRRAGRGERRPLDGGGAGGGNGTRPKSGSLAFIALALSRRSPVRRGAARALAAAAPNLDARPTPGCSAGASSSSEARPAAAATAGGAGTAAGRGGAAASRL